MNIYRKLNITIIVLISRYSSFFSSFDYKRKTKHALQSLFIVIVCVGSWFYRCLLPISCFEEMFVQARSLLRRHAISSSF